MFIYVNEIDIELVLIKFNTTNDDYFKILYFAGIII